MIEKLVLDYIVDSWGYYPPSDVVKLEVPMVKEGDHEVPAWNGYYKVTFRVTE